MAKIIVIGAGFSGLSAAAYLSAAGHEVHVHEKNSSAGGRARQFRTENGYVFDMGPSWYWMPDIFEAFFADFGETVAQNYKLTQLDPSFQIVFKDEVLRVPKTLAELKPVFGKKEKNGAEKLTAFMKEAEYKYHAGTSAMKKMPGISLLELLQKDIVKGMLRLQIFSSFSKHVRKYFSDPKLIALMEFPVLFLGAMPSKMPAMYSLMNYAGLQLGTWYPKGGFGKVVEATVGLAERNGVHFHFDSPIEKILAENGKATCVQGKGERIFCDAIVASADYQHVEEKLLKTADKNYSANYWDKKTLAPSCLIFFLGVKTKIQNLEHHNLFFEEDLALHSNEIYEEPKWPTKPLFYVCCPSKTDDTVAPEGHENLFLLMPLAVGIEDSEEKRERYFDMLMERLERHVGQEIRKEIDYKKSYCIKDFVADYNSFKGNAYGLANTLRQTAILKPSLRNKNIKNLYYTGQLTVPGPGVPPSLISGKLAAQQLIKNLKPTAYENPV